MIRTVISIVLFVLLIVGCVWIYRIVTHDQVSGSGEVLVRSTSEHDQMESGTTYIGDKPVEAHPSTSRSDAPGTINTDPAADYGKTASNGVETTQYGNNAQTAPTDQPVYNKSATVTPYPTQPAPPSPYTQTSLSTDSIPPNPPNGMAFAGTGAYQWYRQGDLTWRIDTKSGASCIDYATLEEWRKPIVYSHGCGGSSHWRRHSR